MAKNIPVKLTVGSRLQLLQRLPVKAGIVAMRTVAEIATRVTPTAEELRSIDAKDIENGLTWNLSKDKAKSFQFSTLEIEVIVGALRKAEEAKSLTQHDIPLWDAFVGE